MSMIHIPNFMLILFGISFTLTFFSKQIAIKKKFLDIPNNRSSHTHVTPTGGGIAIAITFLLGIFVLFNTHLISSILFYTLSIGSGLIAFVGLLDDFWNLSAKLRILVHITASIWILFFLGDISHLNLYFIVLHWGWIGYLISAIFIIWSVNLYNFMDGIDGLAAAEGIFLSFASALLLYLTHEGETSWIYLVIGSSIFGFLIWNWSPAKIFMGDAGSNFLGYVFAALIIYTVNITELTLWPWLILYGVFLTDSTITLLQRLRTGQRWYEAHCSHAYQHAALLLGSHKKATLWVTSINVCWLLPWSILSMYKPMWSSICFIIALTPLVGIALKLKAGKQHV